MNRETRDLEYKQDVSKTYLKTVSAFSNYNDGQIIFGVTDDGKVVGFDDPCEVALKIENQINDAITPNPNYLITINDDNTITLFVKEGEAKPYLYDKKAYKRNDSSTIEVDKIEYSNLVLKGMNIKYESLVAHNQDLTFNSLAKYFKEHLHLESFNQDTLKTLKLYNEKGYNNAALILSDQNDYSGVDMALLDNDINVIHKRYILKDMSLVDIYFKTIEIFKDNYSYEVIEGSFRESKERIPLEAFREALANALIHRRWDLKANVKIEMYQDKLIIHSPGGLESSLSVEDYLEGSFSILRNEIIADVFHRLGIVEIFATGIKRIKKIYSNYFINPEFTVTDSSITIVLPVINKLSLNENEELVLSSMNLNYSYKRVDLEEETGLSKDVLIRTLNSLISKNMIVREGVGPKVLYVKNKKLY